MLVEASLVRIELDLGTEGGLVEVEGGLGSEQLRLQAEELLPGLANGWLAGLSEGAFGDDGVGVRTDHALLLLPSLGFLLALFFILPMQLSLKQLDLFL